MKVYIFYFHPYSTYWDISYENLLLVFGLEASDIKFRSRKVYFYNKLLNNLFTHSDNRAIVLGVRNVDITKIIFLKYFHEYEIIWKHGKLIERLKKMMTWLRPIQLFFLLCLSSCYYNRNDKFTCEERAPRKNNL